uniref:Metalloendopeptidase n=1 Tax=Colubraria reticulata TaxID=604273 RepID=A0A481SP53_9CAEN|nr:CreM12-ShK5 [Colubraria reticulata]
MTVLVRLLVIGLLSVGGDAFTRDNKPTSMDEAIMLAAGKNAYMRRSGNMYTDGLDMVLTREQRRALYENPKARMRGKRLPYVMTPWTDGIVPYRIIGPFDAQRIKKIKEGMKAWERVTCVKFRETSYGDKNSIHIMNRAGCWSMLGMIHSNPQYLSLQADGCFWRGTVEHEFGHALGLVHEHQRPNRDEHISVNEYNIQRTFQSQLMKYVDAVDKMSLPYDYHSVMHYGHFAFSIQPSERHPTINVIGNADRQNQKYTKEIGRVLGPSFIDAKLINGMYKCAERCTQPPYCRSDCYVTHDCKCICKETMPPVLCYDSSYGCTRLRDQDCVTYQFEHEIFCRQRCKMCAVNGTTLPPDKPDLPCQDFSSSCQLLADDGRCTVDKQYMSEYCQKTCKLCPTEGGEDGGTTVTVEEECKDKQTSCSSWAKGGYCSEKRDYMLKECKKSCTKCGDGNEDDKGKGKEDGACEDNNENCADWAKSNQCTINPGYMMKNCIKSCTKCGGGKETGACEDKHRNCAAWAGVGQCGKKPDYMLNNCKKSCTKCDENDNDNGKKDGNCKDENRSCSSWAESGECDNNPGYMLTYCKKSCGVCGGGKVKENCQNENEGCEMWAQAGECHRNPSYMNAKCRKACELC